MEKKELDKKVLEATNIAKEKVKKYEEKYNNISGLKEKDKKEFLKIIEKNYKYYELSPNQDEKNRRLEIIKTLDKTVDYIFSNSELKKKEISFSPYSDSFYLHKKGEKISWGDKPKDSYRFSTHWNFKLNEDSEEVHGRANFDNDDIAFAKIEDGTYTKVDIDYSSNKKPKEVISDNKAIDAISESLSEIYEHQENQAILRVSENIVLTDDRGEFKSTTLINRKKLKNALIIDSNNVRDTFNKALINVNKISAIRVEKLKKQQEEMTSKLLSSALLSYNILTNNVLTLSKAKPLREVITEQTIKGIDKGLPIKVGKRLYGYKEYMEMNTRTTIQNETAEQQLEIGGEVGIVFYICDSYSDCADDHANYQGKLYYDERWSNFNLTDEIKEQIKLRISQDRMLSIQEVREKKPFLTTRPNCRHRFIAVSINQALGNLNTLKQELKVDRGVYRSENAEKVNVQRYNERNIRNYKAKRDIAKELYKQNKNPELKKQYEKYNDLTNKWQKKQRELIENNPFDLERDYRRETRNKVLQDLGARYNLPKG